MTELKCPFCGQELEETMFARGRVFVSCNNPECPIMDWGGCSKQIITELIRTRKALDVAVDALDRMAVQDSIYDIIARNAIKTITALEQKE